MTRKEKLKQLVNLACQLQEEPDDLPTLRKQLEEAQAELRKFWEAKDRPWFCRNDKGTKLDFWGHCSGLLRPESQYGFQCTKCGATYLLNRETIRWEDKTP